MKSKQSAKPEMNTERVLYEVIVSTLQGSFGAITPRVNPLLA
jgi:hypothetical protein